MSLLRKQLLYIKDNIIKRRYKLKELHNKKKELSIQISEIKQTLLDNITEKKDDKGKALYSNATKRDSALKYALVEHKEYNTKSKLLVDLEDEIKECEIELDSFKIDMKIEEICSRYQV